MNTLQISVFQTPLGWFGLLGRDGQLVRVLIGQASRQEVIEAALNGSDRAASDVCDWAPDLRRRLVQFANGEAVDFQDVALKWNRPLTAFRQAVLNATRRIGWGQTVTYGELAALAGSPKAARAVGTSMATNPFPIVIPCHRVVGSGGQLRGFSAPRGVDLKSQMLTMEAGSHEADETQHRSDASGKGGRN